MNKNKKCIKIIPSYLSTLSYLPQSVTKGADFATVFNIIKEPVIQCWAKVREMSLSCPKSYSFLHVYSSAKNLNRVRYWAKLL